MVETFWPPPPRLLRRWRLRTLVVFAAPTVLLLVAVRAAQALVVALAFGFEPSRHAAALLPGALELPLLGIVVALELAFPRLLAWKIGRVARRAPELVSCEEAERLLAACPGVFREASGWRWGVLAVTDRRILRVEHGRQATLATREAARLTVATRHATRRLLGRAALGFVERERGLAIATAEGRRAFFVTERFLLEPLVAWLEGLGPVGYANDADLPAPPPILPLAFAAGPRRRPSSLAPFALVVLALLLLGLMTQVQELTKLYKRHVVRLPELVNVKIDGPLPVLAGTRPEGDERVLARIWVENYAWKGPPTERGIRQLQLVRVGDSVFLRDDAGCEPIGSPGDSIDALIDKARARLSAR